MNIGELVHDKVLVSKEHGHREKHNKPKEEILVRFIRIHFWKLYCAEEKVNAFVSHDKKNYQNNIVNQKIFHMLQNIN